MSSLSQPSELSSDERSIVEEAERVIQALTLSADAKRLIREMIAQPVKMSIPNVIDIWELGQGRRESIPGLKSHVVWLEEGNDKAGYQHMLKHADEFRQLGISQNELVEVAKAATQVGDVVGSQRGKSRTGPGRPIFLMIYKDIPVAVAISIGSNGFLVGMNRQAFDKYLKEGPPINNLGRYQSSDAEITPESPLFHGWVLRQDRTGMSHPTAYRTRYEYHKDQKVTESRGEEPIGEWIYSKTIVGPLDKGFHWYRSNIVTNRQEYT